MSDWYPGGAEWGEFKEPVAVVCPNCHSFVKPGMACSKCGNLLNLCKGDEE